jgi:hypothetical protein
MPALSREQLAMANLNLHYNLPLHPNPYLWAKIAPNIRGKLDAYKKIKFDESIRDYLSTSAKGIYMFFVEPDFPFLPEVKYLMYIGRVIGTNNFKNRFGDYTSGIGEINQRRNKQILTNAWPNHTWVYVFELDLPDNEIEEIESTLINNIIPPCNVALEGTEARSTRSILH